MPSTRRRFALGAAALSGLAGCSRLLGDDQSLRELHLSLWNRTEEPQTLHFALEAGDGLGPWQSFSLDAGEQREVVVEPDPERAWERTHAVAGDEQTTGTLLGQGDERACLQLDYRIEPDELVSLLPSSQSLCQS